MDARVGSNGGIGGLWAAVVGNGEESHMGRTLERRTNRLLDRIAREPLKGAWAAAAGVTVIVSVAAGLLMRLTDPENFGSVWSGLWWATQTTTTVGYGDSVPSSATGRSIAALVMIAGVGFITVTTAAISSVFVESSRRRREGAEASPPAPDGLGATLETQTAQLAALAREVGSLAEEVRRLREASSRPDDGGPGR